MHPWPRRLVELAALMMIGDGLMGLCFPKRYALFWRFGPETWKEFADYLHDHPEMVRTLGAAEAALGVWLAARQLPPDV